MVDKVAVLPPFIMEGKMTMKKLSVLEKVIMSVIVIISVFAILFGLSTGIIVYFKFNSIQMAVTTGFPLTVIGCGSLYILKKMKGEK